MNKILILGAGGYQAFAIKKVKDLGYSTVVVSNVKTDCGIGVADEFVLCSTVEKERVLELAIEYNVQGVFTIASERASVTCAYVAEQLGLKWLDSKLVEVIGDKALMNKKIDKIEPVNYPFMVKPAVSSGSKGVVLVSNETEFNKAILIAKKNSVNDKAITEVWIKGDHLGCVFVVESGKVAFLFLTEKILNQNHCTLAHLANTSLSVQYKELVKEEIQQIVNKLSITDGFFDCDLVIDDHQKVHVIELGSRLGGNGIAELVEASTGFDVISEAIKWSVGEQVVLPKEVKEKCCASIVLCSNKSGKFESFCSPVSHSFSRMFVNKGDLINRFESGSDQIGVAFVEANSEQQLKEMVKGVMDAPVTLLK